ncbi:MAG TPA: hypothetical protein VFY90_07095 [Tepidiformaceae bacterium]|nr:hypothetical protein [Tepidiformaceae bacterium]
MLDLHELASARQNELRAGARDLELRRQYSELRQIERLERALRVARERFTFVNPTPQAG